MNSRNSSLHVGHNAPLRIENPFEISAELIDVVDVSRKLEVRRRTNGKIARIDPGRVIVVREYPADRNERRDRAGERSVARNLRNRRNEQWQCRE